MTDYPLVSVAIITYNQKQFLQECIDSVLAQDYPNFEIVVADDGSTDGTHEMLKTYEQKFPGKFHLVLSEKNEGITANSNRAHFACRGKYIAWMGGDDLMLPGKIRRQVEFMEAHPDCTICYHDLDVFDSETGKTLYLFSEQSKPREGDARVLVRFGTFNGACSTMVRRDKTPKEGFNPTIPVASDWLYWVETLMSGGKICYIGEVLGKYRRHSGNITIRRKNIFPQNIADHLNSCNIILLKYPSCFSDVMHYYSKFLISLRHELPYFPSLFTSFCLAPHWKSFARMMAHLVTLGKWKP